MNDFIIGVCYAWKKYFMRREFPHVSVLHGKFVSNSGETENILFACNYQVLCIEPRCTATLVSTHNDLGVIKWCVHCV